ncbi:transposase, partial [Methylobacterium sp. J-070]|uniref:transposase n=1 Tax=Methylobacterium sp. J-070 TaxID=2836650 RepID=UPI001FB93DCF
MRRGQETSAEQVVLKLRPIQVQTAQGKSLAVACKEAEISEQGYYRWRKEYGGLQADQATKMKDLERENARLRRLVADLSLGNQVLADVASEGWSRASPSGPAQFPAPGPSGVNPRCSTP